MQFAEGIGYPVELEVVGDPAAPADDLRHADESIVIDFVERTVRRPFDGERCRYRFRVARPLVERLITVSGVSFPVQTISVKSFSETSSN